MLAEIWSPFKVVMLHEKFENHSGIHCSSSQNSGFSSSSSSSSAKPFNMLIPDHNQLLLLFLSNKPRSRCSYQGCHFYFQQKIQQFAVLPQSTAQSPSRSHTNGKSKGFPAEHCPKHLTVILPSLTCFLPTVHSGAMSSFQMTQSDLVMNMIKKRSGHRLEWALQLSQRAFLQLHIFFFLKYLQYLH